MGGIGAAALVCLCALILPAATSAEVHAPIKPLDAAAEIASAFSGVSVVLVGEVHGWQAEHDFFHRLLREKQVQSAVRDIVVEFGNARYQSVVDRYVAGERVPLAQVRQAWEKTTQLSVWSAPVYAQFFADVRRINRSLPSGHRYRIVLGDPPIDWSRAGASRQLDYWITQRDPHFAWVVHRQVLSRGRKALVIAGVDHVLRSPTGLPTLTNLLEGRARCSADPAGVRFGIDWCDNLRTYRSLRGEVIAPVKVSLDSDAANLFLSWPKQSIAKIRGTSLAHMPASRLLDDPHPGALKDVTDALLYLGSE